MLIYLIRHGETQWNKKRKLQGQSDIPLDDSGIRLTKITAEALKDIPFDRVYSSPLIRARQTAEILCEGKNLPITEDKRLMEFHFGIAEGWHLKFINRLHCSSIYSCFNDPEHYTRAVLGGETIENVEKRGREFMEEVIKPLENDHRCVLVTAHGGIIRAILGPLMGIPKKNFWTALSEKNCAVNLMECKNGHFTVLETGKLFY